MPRVIEQPTAHADADAGISVAFKRVETLVDDAATARPDHPALRFADRIWTYAALCAEMDRRAALLVAAGLAPADVVFTAPLVSDDYALALLACCRADLTLMHCSAKITAAELRPLARRAGVRLVLTPDGAPHPALPDVPALPLHLPGVPDAAALVTAHQRSACGTAESVACIQLTSGTTDGMPKLVQMPHRFFTWMAGRPPWWQTPDGVYYMPRPTLLATRTVAEVFAIGGTMVLSVATRPETIEAEMAAFGVTALWTTPAVLHLLAGLTVPPPALALRYVRFGAAPLRAEIASAVAARYRVPLINEYGSTEGGSLISTPDGGAPDGSLGLPYPGVAARIVDADGHDVPDGASGELIVRTPALMRGYLSDPDATAEALRDGWLWTGDLARRDADGFFFYEGRRGLRINVGGFKVSPEEVEAVLEEHPAVRECVVLGMADAARGEVVRAIIVPQGAPPTAGALRRFCRARLAAYKVPRRFEFRDALPRSSLGKVLRHEL